MTLRVNTLEVKKNMPNAKILEEKKALVAALIEKIKNSPAGVLVDYKGINVEDDTKLRRAMREAGVEYFVVKNTMLRFAAQELGFEGFMEHLNGTTAIAISTNDDVVSPAKIICEYAKTHENYNVKVGFLEGAVIPASEVEALAKMPNRETLIAQTLYSFNFPIMQLAIALDAIAKKSEDGEALVSTLVAPQEEAPAAE